MTLSTAVVNGYELLAIAFGTVDGATVGMNKANCDNFSNGCFTADISEDGSEWLTTFHQDVEQAQWLGAKIVLSFGGGGGNTFQPFDSLTGYNVDVDVLADNLVIYIQETLQIDGVDFDLEAMAGDEFSGSKICCYFAGENQCIYDTSPNAAMQICRAEYFYDLVKEIKILAPNMLVIAPPQININVEETALELVNTANEKVFQRAIDENLFDYIFAQTYNTLSFTVNADCDVAATTEDDALYTEFYPEFIGLVYPCIQALLPDNNVTKPYIGQPANDVPDAGLGALIYGSYDDIAAEYTVLTETQYRNFGGAMVWSINIDAEDTDGEGNTRVPFTFIDTISPALSE